MSIQRVRRRWLRRPLVKPLVGPLCLWVALMPALVSTAGAQRPSHAPEPSPGPVPVPVPDSGGVPFLSHGTGLGVEAENGFVISMANGEWRHEGHTHVGGSGSISSPWGEQMAIRYWVNADGSFAVEYDGNATIHYALDEVGRLRDIMTVTEEGTTHTYVGDRAQRAVLGALDLWSLDVEPYRAVLAQVSRNHSSDFLAGSERLNEKLRSTRLSVPAGCAGDILACTGSILGWIATVPAIAAGCTAGGAVSLGLTCLGAIIAHEGATVAAVGTCINAIQNCSDNDDPHGDPSGGCSGPGGTE